MEDYRTIRAKLETLQPFRGNSLSAFVDANGTYQVFSYSTLIAQAWQGSAGIVAKVSEERYSSTTSKHQNMIRDAWGIARKK